MKKIIFLIFYIAFVSSCLQQMEAPESARVAGSWAVIDENNMTTSTLTFQDGYFEEYQSYRACYVEGKTVWGVDESTFERKSRNKYSLIDGVLYCADKSVKFVVENEVMTFGANKCLPIDDLNPSFYSEIVLSKTNKTSFLYSDREIEWHYDIENPVEGFNLVVKEAPEWCGGLKGVTVEGDKIRFTVQSTTENLSGKFVFSYLSAANVEVRVKQSAAQIALDRTSAMFDYSSATGEFAYTIPNKQEGYELEVKTDADWIKDIKNQGDKITYSVLENNSGAERTGKIELTYAGVIARYNVTQAYSASSVNLTPSSATHNYAGGTFSFKYNVENPREGQKVSVSTSDSWITGLKDSNGTVSYTITENNIGSSRTGKITLKYGVASKEFTVAQTYEATSLTLTPASGSHDYTGGTYTFKYTVSNPREGQKAMVSTSDSWITGVSDTDGTVTYNVGVNTTGSSRSGKITVKYGGLSSTFAITQAVASLTLSSSSVTCNYASVLKSFNITIPNRQSDLAVGVRSDVSWITDVSESDGTVSYTVAENNSGASRSGNITVSYAGVSKVFSLTQTYEAPSLTLTPASGSHDYTSGTYTFKYTVSNPREGQEVSVSASESWVTDVVDDGKGNVSYTVVENNNSSQRVGKIKLHYAGVSVEFTIIQSYPCVNLSQNGTANCYIISETGVYSFSLKKGNSNISVGDVLSAEVLWESYGTSTIPSVGDLVKWVLIDGDSVVFESANSFKEGNALIAAKDAFGAILWSWHIWFTDQPQAQVYQNNAGTMMDRNLGATSTTPGDICALGLLYQWGRKDPFLGSSSIRDKVEAKSTIVWPSCVSANSLTGTIEYATTHPTTFITYNRDNYDWYYTGSSLTDNTRWTTSEKSKSIYDPCPSGWRVPDGGNSGVWSKTGFDDTTFDMTNRGISFSISSPPTTWYPASGYRLHNDGSFMNVGSRGHYWSASYGSYYAYDLFFEFYDSVNPTSYHYRALGQSVRCIQESK